MSRRVREKSFAKQIRELRDREQLSQSEAAAAWGVQLKTLQNWEIERSIPTPFVAKCILFWIEWRNKVPLNKRR